jgi:hypothetical protein
VERCKKCIACQGRYFEKKRPSPNLHTVPTRSNKVSPRTFQTDLVYGKPPASPVVLVSFRTGTFLIVGSPRSPYLTPLMFFFCGFVRELQSALPMKCLPVPVQKRNIVLCVVPLIYVLTSPLRSRWNIGPQQLSVAEVSVTFKFFIETGLLALCSNP